MKQLKIFWLISVIVISCVIVKNISKGILKNISDEDRIKLMKVLKIESSSTFLPIQIKRNDCAIH